MSLKSAKKTADKFAPGHHQGKFYGYNINPEGHIFPAPMFTDRMAAILDRQVGVNDLLIATEKYVADELSRLATERRKWWSDVVEDIGFDKKCVWEYDHNNRCMIQKKDEKVGDPPDGNP